MFLKLVIMSTFIVYIKSQFKMFDPFVFHFQEKIKNQVYEAKNNQILKNYRQLIMSPVTENTEAVLHCKTFVNCESCLKSDVYACGWCHNYGCVIAPQRLCPKAKNFENTHHRSLNQSFCTAINQDRAFINVEHGSIEIKVNIRVSDPAIYQQDIKCLILLSGYKNLIVMSGWIVQDEVRCEPFYKPKLEYAKGTFQLFWGGALPDSPQIPLVLFSCSNLAHNCETCAVIPAQFECGWCSDNKICTSSAYCRNKWTKSNEVYCQSSTYNGRRKYISFKITQVPLEIFPVAASTKSYYFQFPNANDIIPLRLRRGEVSTYKSNSNNVVTTKSVIQNANVSTIVKSNSNVLVSTT